MDFQKKNCGNYILSFAKFNSILGNVIFRFQYKKVVFCTYGILPNICIYLLIAILFIVSLKTFKRSWNICRGSDWNENTTSPDFCRVNLYSYKVHDCFLNEEKTRKCLRRMEQTSGQLWHRYSKNMKQFIIYLSDILPSVADNFVSFLPKWRASERRLKFTNMLHQLMLKS